MLVQLISFRHLVKVIILMFPDVADEFPFVVVYCIYMQNLEFPRFIELFNFPILSSDTYFLCETKN